MPGERLSRAQLRALSQIYQIHIGKLKVPSDHQLRYLQQQIGAIEDEFVCEMCEIVFLSTQESAMVAIATQKLQLRREARLFWTSVGLLVLALIAVFVVPEPTRMQIFVLQLITSLAAAGFVAFIPGLLA